MKMKVIRPAHQDFINNSIKGIKPDQLSSSPPSPFKNILPDNNAEKKSDNAGSKELDGGRYLHKKFKKVATLEEVPETAACGGDEVLERASGAGTEIDGALAPAQGRYVCPYCAMPCAKPSVLQKHIRAHTNERPYPCRPCGFAFKTKSNLYKHCRSRSHTLKMDVADCCPNPSSEDDDSRHSSCPAAEDDDRPNSKNKIYKPKFHTLQGESSEGRDSSPSPDFLHYRINRLICEGDSELIDHPVPRQSWNPPRSSPLEKEDSPEAASPFPSKLALALLRPGTTSIEPQPLNLSQKESSACGGEPTHSIDSSIIKDILLRARSGLNGFKENTIGCVECPDCKAVVDKLDIHLRVGCRAQLENSRHQQFSQVESNHDYPPVSSRTPEAHPLLIRMEKPPDLASLSRLPVDGSRPVEAPPPLTRLADLSVIPRKIDSSLSMGNSPECSTVLSKPSDSMPALGRTSLVEPAEKKRKLSPRPACLPDLIPTTESPQKSIRLFGGKVKILDGPGGEARTLRIESGRESPPPCHETRDPKDRRVLTIANTGLHSVGLTVIQSDCEATRKPCESLNGKIAIPILSNIPRNLDPLTTITAYNPLTLPPRSSDIVPLTIVHGGKPIPHVPGMPGPNSLLDPPSLIRKPLDEHATTPTHSISQEPQQSLHRPPSVEDMTTRASVVSPIPIASTSPQPNCTESSEKKFVRPTWLPLKAGTFVAKKPLGALGLGPPPVALVSPETPRPRKSYGQLYLNGHAYTYLGLKCSSRMFFCTLNKPQPIYVPLSPEHATLSMYSNWKVVSESALSPLGLSPICVMSSYDSRNHSSRFSQAGTTKCQVVHSSYSQRQSSPTSRLLASSPSQMKELQILEDEDPKRLKICNGGYESTEDYIYIRGRGRGKYVCEECGVRCCKPSMLKKHIRTTHSDLRPYSCKHCSFSFKTKGNLTKHMKSKAHYKQCIDLDITPVPTTVTDVNIDHESLARQNARCKELGGDIEGSSEETEEEDEEEELPESEDEEGKIEREAAASLLSLSEVAQQSAMKDYANLGLISTMARPLTYPYSLPTVIRKSLSSDRDDQDEPLELTASSQSSHSSDITTPIDLSNKTTSEGSVKSFETDTSMLSMLSTPIATLSALSPVLPSPLGTPSVISDEGCALMTAYLKEKAARDTLMKQQQYRSNSCSLRLSLTEERCLMLDSPTISTSERNQSPMSITSMSDDSRPVDCRFPVRSEGFRPVEKKTPTTDCGRPVVETRPVDSHNQPVESQKLLLDSRIRPVESHKLLIDSHRSMNSHNQLVDSQNRPADCQRMPLKIVSRPIDVIVRPMEQIRPESQENMEASASDSEAMEVDVESMDHSPVDYRDKRSEECQTPTAAPSVSVNHSAKESALGILALTSSQAAKTPASILPPQSKLKAEFIPPASGPNYINVLEEGRSICAICQKVFTKPSQLRLHVNIHYFERPFRCDACGVSFRTKGHLQKHQRSISHLNKVNMNSTFGTATMSNPRPFKCTDCKIAFRIHGHLAKHLRSKMHIMRLECLGKLPFGMYAELERSGLNIHDIDTTDCHNSLESLQLLARKLHENDPTKLGQWAAPVEMMGQGGMDGGAMDMPASAGETSSDEDEPSPASLSQLTASHSIQR